MSFEHRSTKELIQVALAGGGFILDAAHRQTPELVHIAKAANQGGVKVIFRGMTNRQTAELIQIAAAGKGAVTFEG